MIFILYKIYWQIFIQQFQEGSGDEEERRRRRNNLSSLYSEGLHNDQIDIRQKNW